VDEAREIVGETAVSNAVSSVGKIEPIPESQDEINKQADGAIRDLFPRIPNTDRQMIIDHAFRKVRDMWLQRFMLLNRTGYTIPWGTDGRTATEYPIISSCPACCPCTYQTHSYKI
jgi:hypothetical protein